jgi:hypothetical protein
VPAFANLVTDVRTALKANDFSHASELIRGYRASNGVTAEMLEAQSWIARGQLAAKRYDDAEKTATETYNLAVIEAKKRPVDRDPSLATALGAAIEVEANALAGRNQHGSGHLSSRPVEDVLRDFDSYPHSKESEPADAGGEARAGA